MLINNFPEKKKFRRVAEKFNVIPVCAEVLADMETPVSLFEKIYDDKGPAFLFESVEGGERWGRYSFLSGSAMMDIKIFRQTIKITTKNFIREISHKGDPFSVLKQIMEPYVPAGMPELPRFWGGLVGYLSYETVSFFEKIPKPASR